MEVDGGRNQHVTGTGIERDLVDMREQRDDLEWPNKVSKVRSFLFVHYSDVPFLGYLRRRQPPIAVGVSVGSYPAFQGGSSHDGLAVVDIGWSDGGSKNGFSLLFPCFGGVLLDGIPAVIVYIRGSFQAGDVRSTPIFPSVGLRGRREGSPGRVLLPFLLSFFLLLLSFRLSSF